MLTPYYKLYDEEKANILPIALDDIFNEEIKIIILHVFNALTYSALSKY